MTQHWRFTQKWMNATGTCKGEFPVCAQWLRLRSHACSAIIPTALRISRSHLQNRTKKNIYTRGCPVCRKDGHRSVRIALREVALANRSFRTCTIITLFRRKYSKKKNVSTKKALPRFRKQNFRYLASGRDARRVIGTTHDRRDWRIGDEQCHTEQTRIT